MKIVTKILTVALFVSALSFGAIIDSFGVNHPGIIDNTLNAVSVSTTVGNRTLTTFLTGGTGSTTTEVGGGLMTASNGALATGTNTASYTGMWDLTSPYSTVLTLNVLSVENYAGGQIRFFIEDTGSGSASTQFSVPVAGWISADVSLFTGVVNLAAIDRIGFSWIHDPGSLMVAQDVVFDDFGYSQIPEPGTYAMMAAGLLGLFAIRRKMA